MGIPHSTLVYLPILTGILGSLVAVAAALQPGPTRSRAAAALLIVAACGSWWAKATGSDARNALRDEPSAYTAIKPALDVHGTWADRVPPALWAAALAALTTSLRGGRNLRLLTVVLSLLATAILILTAIQGSAVASARMPPSRGTPSAPPLSGFGAAD